MPREIPQLDEIGLEDLGFQVEQTDYQSPIRQEIRKKLSQMGIEDREPDITIFRDEDGARYALVGFNQDGHGSFTILKARPGL